MQAVASASALSYMLDTLRETSQGRNPHGIPPAPAFKGVSETAFSFQTVRADFLAQFGNKLELNPGALMFLE